MLVSVFKDPKDYKPGDIIISSAAIEQRLEQLVQEIVQKYTGKQLLVVGLLKGAAWITVDIFTRLYQKDITDAQLSFMRVKSYAEGTTSQKEPTIAEDLDSDPKGRHVLLIDDICDTGKSLQVVHRLLQNRKAASVATFVLLDKPSRRKVDFTPDYIGFSIPNIWVQGRGMDTDEWGRGNPDIICGPVLQ